MEIVSIILFGFTLLYAGFIIALIYGFQKVKLYEPSSSAAETTFSIVVPFRNEQHNLPRLLQSFAEIDYPRSMFELIFVDDFSEDNSVDVITKWRMAHGQTQVTVIDNLHLTGSPKKDALSRAIPIVRNKWIITTDADCEVLPNWLATLNAFTRSHDADMLVGSVACESRNSLIGQFQSCDFLSLQGATIGSFGIGNPFMCNGANFAYTKEVFLSLGGFSGNDNIASGDDVFLLQKAIAQSKRVHYLKSAGNIVTTQPVSSWKSLFDQRVRWASKTGSYTEIFGQDLALAVFVGNLSIVIGLVFYAVGYWNIALLIILFAIKIVPDLILLIQTNRFIYRGKFFFPLVSTLIYPFFCVSVALYSIFGKYHWKGRKYSS